jgi:TPR repeat protein
LVQCRAQRRRPLPRPRSRCSTQNTGWLSITTEAIRSRKTTRPRYAERGYAPAQLALAQCYARGHGIPRDPILAYMWANLAASQITRETPEGDFAQGYRDYTRFRLTPPELQEAQQMATTWRPIGAAAP